MSATVMVLEDDPALQDLLCEVLQDEGHTVIAVATFAALVEHIPRKVDLLISDMLVDLRPIGLEAINAVREATKRPVPAILCTGAANHIETHHVEISQLGAFVLHKPFSIDGLINAVNAALQPIPNVCA